MNYLAHLFLADATPASMAGNLTADFVKGDAILFLRPDVQAGIRQHRAIDRFTDTHPLIKQSRMRLGERWTRVSGIIIDVYCDHLLARNWERYSPVPLRAFLNQAYAEMAPIGQLLPDRVRDALVRIVESDLLMGYSNEAGVLRSLTGLSRRLRNGQFELETAMADLRLADAALEEDFLSFFPEAMRFAPLAGIESA